MSKETAEVLKKAKALIDAPEKWTKHARARDAERITVDEMAAGACSFCAIGAAARAAGGNTRVWYPAVEALSRETPREVVCLNDDPLTTHAEIMHLYDRAIATESATADGFDVREYSHD